MKNEGYFLYLARVVTYGEHHPIKVGVSINPLRRMRHLAQIGIHRPSLVGWCVISSRKDAFRAERAVCKAFPHDKDFEYSREILAVSLQEIIVFLEKELRLRFYSADALYG